MTQPKYAKVFPPLESDPALFTLLLRKLGSSPTLHFEDVLSLDDTDLLALIPGRIVAFVLISPFGDTYAEPLEHEDSQRLASTNKNSEAAENVIWLQQTIHNACGLYALLHAVCNIPSVKSHCVPGSFIDALLKATSADECQRIIETNQDLDNIYIPIALQGQTAVLEDWAWEPPFHYVCFVGAHGRVWELNGGGKGPVDRGIGRDLMEVVKTSVKDQGEGSYSLLALVESAECVGNQNT